LSLRFEKTGNGRKTDENKNVTQNGADIFIESLKAEGVEVIFGYPGGAVLHIYDAIQRHAFPHILCRQEAAGVHMADGYARSTGKTGVALVTSGPGLSNAITGIATAYSDSIPMVIFSGQVPTNLIGTDSFQEADNSGLTRPVSKHNYLVRDVKDLAPTIKEAFHIASSGRPGPVVVDIPKDISGAHYKFSYPDEISLPHYQPRYEGHKGQIRRAMKMLLRAKRPVLYFGGGVVLSGASEEMTALVDLLKIPTTYTLMGIGGIPGNHPDSLGMLGMHGTYRANLAVDQCDVLFAIGARFDDRVTGKLDEFSVNSKKIHIDIDPTSIGKCVETEIPIVGDVKNCLQQLLARLHEQDDPAGFHEQIAPWRARVADWNNEHPIAYDQQANGPLLPQFVLDKIFQMTEGKAVMTTDVGQHQMWAAQYYHAQHPNLWVTSGGLGTMGFGMPAAIGAQVARPDDLVIAVVGDGGFMMNIQELTTMVEQDVPVKIVLLNNHVLGMVRQWQEKFYDNRESSIDLSAQPDFMRLAEAFGLKGMQASTAAEAEKILKDGFAYDGPVLMEFCTERGTNCYPMVPAGAPSAKMLTSDS
jgi:acetolactate synthase-1/2/3 large subunit